MITYAISYYSPLFITRQIVAKFLFPWELKLGQLPVTISAELFEALSRPHPAIRVPNSVLIRTESEIYVLEKFMALPGINSLALWFFVVVVYVICLTPASTCKIGRFSRLVLGSVKRAWREWPIALGTRIKICHCSTPLYHAHITPQALVFLHRADRK